MALHRLQNRFLSLTVDGRGRIVSLLNRQTGTELITHSPAAEAWRVIVPTGRHTIDIILGSRQTPARIAVRRTDDGQALTIAYERVVGQRTWPIRMRLTWSLPDEACRVSAYAELDNRARAPVEEFEFPVVGGVGGLAGRGQQRTLHLAAGGDCGNLYSDVLSRGLPETGREANHFTREHETAMFERTGAGGAWIDLWCPREGVFFGYAAGQGDFALKLEKFPKEVPNAPVHRYPPQTPRWLRVWALHVPRVQPGGTWRSAPVEIMPHRGDWHAGADRYAALRRASLRVAQPVSWMAGFVGWTEILGQTYLGEVFHDYAGCAEAVVRDRRVTGLDCVFYYGHSRLGAEGADFDHAPAPALGGADGFRRMVEKLHRHGVRIILLDHFHRWINRDVAEYAALGLARHAVLDVDGRPVTARWWKETFLSCRRLAGPTPEWVEMCPSSRVWRRCYQAHVERMIALGVDGLELDTFDPGRCYSRRHGHAPGADLLPIKLEFMRAVRAAAHEMNPDFALIGETMTPETRAVLDGFYPDRYATEAGRVHRYLFPELRQQTVLVGNYAYDQVNKALALGIGVDTEIWGLRRTARAACPELAEYIGEINRFKRRYAAVLIRGTFRDTVGARVAGDCLYAVLLGPGRSRALVLRNPQARPARVRAALRNVAGLELRVWRPFGRERRVRALPLGITLKPYEAAVVLALERAPRR
jgi:hypothetical protein